MYGSTWGKCIKVSTWGESHGRGIGVVIDGIPAGLSLCEEDIQVYLDRRRPGQSKYTTKRAESDRVEIMSGVFEKVTLGTPISLLIRNADAHSKDYSDIKDVYRPGHADYTFDAKYGIRDYRGGGRSSGRETAARVAAGAVCARLLKEFSIELSAYTYSIGEYEITKRAFDEINKNLLYMPDNHTAGKAQDYLDKLISQKDSCGGIVECVIKGVPEGLGDTVFDKLDADLAKAMLSIGATKGFEIGEGFNASRLLGSEDNDEFYSENDSIKKRTNHSGGVLGGMSDGSDIVFKVAFKPTPSIARTQHTVDKDGNETEIEIKGRHDPIIVPRAVVVVECMAAIVLCDKLISNAASRMDNLKKIYG